MARSDSRAARECWQDVPRDPTPEDLGYAVADWEVIRARKDDTGHLMFLPDDEEMLRDEAFIVADAYSVCNVGDRI